jgi:uncharacterized membrane protein
MLRRTAMVALVAAGPVLTATPGIADITFCNLASESVSVAFGFLDQKKGWTAAGWYALEPGGCNTIWKGRMTNTVYYSYVVSNTIEWKPPARQKGGFFCISKDKFTLETRRYSKRNVIDCENHGLETAQFTQFNTGGSANVRHNIRAPGASQPSAPPPPAPTSTPGTSVESPSKPGGSACQRFPNLC